jgi:hypothetical protein
MLLETYSSSRSLPSSINAMALSRLSITVMILTPGVS